ncbi:MAG: DUF512 domain-containing protein [Lachnospiraceae bacterium]|nr:DUF512 domain-containing protein [Lachnospiraceae bacterium]
MGICVKMTNKRSKGHLISKVYKGSPAEACGILPKDNILRINGKEVEDIFDYRYDILEAHLEFEIQRNDEVITLVMDKDEDEDPGIEFENGLMDDYRSCRNKCIFCFIDQMPPGMRPTLYFKDDDSRLSFLQGNYITLTNLSEADIERIIKFRMEPINISFQTTNPELRVKMLNNRFAGECLKITDRFYEAGILMNGQIVLCKGYNDGLELKRTIEDLSKYLPHLQSVSVVPIGMTKFREGLCHIEPFTKKDCEDVIDLIESYQQIFYDEYGLHFIHASDEWYISAGRPLPEEERYDGYLQLENGVGMVRLMENEFNEAFEECAVKGLKKKFMKPSECTVVTGKLVYPYIKKFADKIMAEYPKVTIDVAMIRNDFFGETITVTGLLTGQDIVKQLRERGCKKRVLLPQNTMKADEEIFLDDMTLSEFKETLQVKVDIVKSSGRDLFLKMLKDGE